MKKSNYSKNVIQAFLINKLKANIELQPVSEGMESQVYSYSLDNKDYIIRINCNLEGFKKDKYAYEHFSRENILIPKVIDIGKFNDSYYYCISEKMPGNNTYEDSSKEVIIKLLPDITNIMESINNIDISNTIGYGIFDSETGNAPWKTWKEYLMDIINNKKYDWEKIKKSDYYDSNLIDKLMKEFKKLVPYCKEIRKLRHGDYGTNNIIVDETPKFTGVINWDLAGYGDPFYEVASAHFWSTWLLCMDITFNYWKKIYGNILNFDKIIKCYALRIGLVEIYENADNEDMNFLNWIQNRCKEIMEIK